MPWLVLRCVVSGEIDPQTGYLCNVKSIDQALRDIVTAPLLEAGQTAEQLIRIAWHYLVQNWNLDSTLERLEVELSPYLSYSIEAEKSQMILLTQQFEFSAAHRLHCPEFSDEENRQIFGKCNNPEGHGHNYVVEVTLGRRLDSAPQGNPGQVIELGHFEATVKEQVIDRLDHKHLNRDVEYFQSVNPSVENIAIAIWDWLKNQFDESELVCVRVYETPKTWAEYRGMP